jgi:hypothetical protein
MTGRNKIAEILRRERLGPFTLPRWMVGELGKLREERGLMESELLERAVLNEYDLANKAAQQYPKIKILVDKGPFIAGQVLEIAGYRYQTKTYIVKDFHGRFWEFNYREAVEINV